MAEAKETEECILRLDLAVTLTASARFYLTYSFLQKFLGSRLRRNGG